MAKQVFIRVGHPAYQGANAVRLCFSKSQAVRVLRNRGVKRDDARKAIKTAVLEGGSIVKPNILDQIEINSMSHPGWAGYYVEPVNVLRRQWAGRSEA